MVAIRQFSEAPLRWLRLSSAATAQFSELTSIVSLLLMTLLVSAQVILRYIFGMALPWAEEAAIYMMVWMAFVGSAVALRYSEHIALNILVDRFSGPFASIVTIGVNVVILIFLGIVLVLSVQLAFIISGQRSPALGINMYWPYLILPLGCCLMVVEILDRLFLLLMPGHTRRGVS